MARSALTANGPSPDEGPLWVPRNNTAGHTGSCKDDWQEDYMTVIPVSKTRLLIEVAPDVDPAETASEVTSTSGTSYQITPSGSARMGAAQGPVPRTWVKATPRTTTPRVHPWDV